jgi:hypothetical protein
MYCRSLFVLCLFRILWILFVLCLFRILWVLFVLCLFRILWVLFVFLWFIVLITPLVSQTFLSKSYLSYIHDRSPSCRGTCSSITSGKIKLIIWTQAFPLSEIMLSCNCCLHAGKMTTLIYNWVHSVVLKSSEF